ncbi:UNVERIFIED_CONTAM: hypothetical protein RMT77_007369 [Armadillidium vulgare]
MEFCDSDFWNLTITWNTTSPSFTSCFEKTIFVSIPCAYLWLFSIYEFYRIKNSKNGNIPFSWVNISKIVLTVVLGAVQLDVLIANIIIHKNGSEENESLPYGVDFFYPSVLFITLVLHLVLVVLEKRKGIQTSGVIFGFWFLMLICQVPAFKSSIIAINHGKDIASLDSRKEAAILCTLMTYPLLILIFLVNCFADKPPQKEYYPRGPKYSPELDASFLSKITFSWLDRLIWKGYRNPLKQEDLYDLPPGKITNEMLKRWDANWKKVYKDIKWDKKKPETIKELKELSILSVILRTFYKPLLIGAIFKFIPDMIVFITPQLINLIIEYQEKPEIEEWKGYLYAASLFAVTELQSFLNAQQYVIMNITGLKIRSMVISAVYQKALKISSSSKKESTVGEIVNLMAVDVQRFLDLIGYINTLWTAPIQIILCMYFLWVQLGPSAMVGLVILLILIPINGVIARFQKIYQIAQMKKKDKRIKLINEILNGIKVLKLYAWEMSFNHYITGIRKEEVKVLKKNAMLGAITSFILSCTPFMVSFFMFMTYVLLSNQLTPGTVFVSISLLNILRMPMVMIPFLIISMVQANVSLKRMNKFLRSEELDPLLVERDEKEEDPLVIKDGNFMWGGEESETPTLRNINLRVKEGSLVGIVGTVGCGKSSLCLSMLGEMDKLSGKVIINKSLAYVPQQAWIQNETIKENILFGKEFHSALYNKVVSACALEPDFKMLANGDQTEIGEKGINLSGGQKQRVNLARAVYSDSEIYLLDDPLSAVDSHVGKHIFEHVIGPKGILKDKTRILVTHGLGYLKNMDEIIVLKDGEIVERGTLTFLINQKGDFQDFLMQYLNQNEFDDEELDPEVLEEIRKTIGDNPLQRQKSQVSQITVDSNQSYGLRDRRGTVTSSIKSFEKKKEVEEDIDKGKIIKEEDTGGGRMSWGVYVYYARSIGTIAFSLTVFYYAASQTFSVLGNVLLSQWSEDENSMEIGIRNKYLGAYAGFGAGQSIFSFLGYYVMTWYAINASKGLHNRMLDNVLRCPMTFFDQTPIGRIVNRFSKDVDVVDVLLPMNLRTFIWCLTMAFSTFGAIIYATPMFTTVAIPAVFIYYIIQNIYVTSSRQLKRIESVTRSPIYTHFGESIQGSTTIRAYRKQSEFIEQSRQKVDYNQTSYYLNIVSYRWLSIRLELIGNLLTFFAALFTVLNRDINGGNTGMALTYALQVTQVLTFLVRITSDVETNIVSVERIREYTKLPQEAPWEIKDQKPPKEWPQEGKVKFDNYSTRYREGLDLVVKNIKCDIKSTEKIGIVGRTGAGKSSLTLALFRIIEPANGTILIDGIDIAKIGLHDLRGRITIIPQDPVLFSGTMRMNLDPFENYDDNSLWDALEHSHLKDFVSSLPLKLNHAVSEGGDNLSVGQRQLVCLARALLRKSKVLILDEATAAVDLETDALIQETIRKEFADSTILTIAHRLNTIMDSSRIIVLEKGEVQEFDTPEKLLENKNSLFYSLAKSAGLV